MKLINEYTTKVLILIFCLVISLEICVFFFIYKNSQSIYKKIYKDTLEKSAKKGKETMEMINHFMRNLFMYYMTKLKLISKHIFLFNGNVNSINDNSINKNSKIFKKNNLVDKIIEAKTEAILEKPIFKEFFNETTGKFDYVENYIKKYENQINKNKLIGEHDELNYISYKNFLGDEFNLNDLGDGELKKLNFLIPIFKSVFLERLITKRDKMDIIRISLLTPNKLIIYPPEDFSKIYLYDKYNFCTMFVFIGYYPDYYSCFYESIDSYAFRTYDNDMPLISIYEDFDNLIYSICMKLSYFQGNNLEAVLCIDVNFGHLINGISLPQLKNFDFGLIKFLEAEISHLGFDYSVFYNMNRKPNEIKKIFNNSECTPYDYVIKEDKYNYYSLYYVLYLETTKVLIEHPELNINISGLETEYKDIVENISNSLLLDSTD